MKKDDTRNTLYPVYPSYPGYPMSPMMPPYQMPMVVGVTTSCSNSDLSNLKDEVDMLKKRVSYLENNLLSNNYSNYNSSNYQVM